MEVGGRTGCRHGARPPLHAMLNRSAKLRVTAVRTIKVGVEGQIGSTKVNRLPRTGKGWFAAASFANSASLRFSRRSLRRIRSRAPSISVSPFSYSRYSRSPCLYVIRHVQLTYARRQRLPESGLTLAEQNVVTASKPPQPIASAIGTSCD